MKHRDYVLLYINGKRVEIRGKTTSVMLADFIRESLHLTGTKVVCAEGDCGACTVLRKSCVAGAVDSTYLPINSCISNLAQLDGSSLITVEYLSQNGLDPIQKSLVECHGTQCGFCTPGFVMALRGMAETCLAKKSKSLPITKKKVMNSLTGNLCRCTGYESIIQAGTKIELEKLTPFEKDPVLRRAERELQQVTKIGVLIQDTEPSIEIPKTAKEASQILKKTKGTRVLGSGTDLGVLQNKLKHITPPKLLSLHLIPDLYQIKKTGTKTNGMRLRIGARVTIERLRSETKGSIPVFSQFLDIFASPQIKNIATLVGNVANASPIGDTIPFLLSMDAKLHLIGPNKKRTVDLDAFYVGYKKTALGSDEFIESIEFDLPEKNEAVYLLKATQRKDLDISTVNGSLRLSRTKIRLALGGVAATPIRLKPVEKYWLTHQTDPNLLNEILARVQAEIHPLSDLRGNQALRRLLVENFLKKSFSEHEKRDTTC